MSNPINALFGRSPIRPVQEHMSKAHDCVVLLGEYLEATFEHDWEKAELLQQAIGVAENEADSIKSNVRRNLPKSLFLPVARTDLLELLSIQDHLANRAKDIAGLMLGRQMEFPDKLIKPTRKFYKCSLDTSAQALKVINELDELLEAGFRGKEVQVVEAQVRRLDELEHKSDVSQIALRAKLFSLEDTLPPVNVMFLYRVINLIADISDIAERVGSRLLILVAH